MLTIGRLGHGRAAADYYIDHQAGCGSELAYYTGDAGEPRGRWCGSAVPMLGVRSRLDEAGEAVLRGLLAGCRRDGETLVGPVWRGDPRGRVSAAVLVRAIEGRAAQTGRVPEALLGDGHARTVFEAVVAALAVDARVPRRPRASLPVLVAQRLAVAAGLDPVVVFRGPDGGDGFGAAVRFADARVDVRRAGLDLTFSAPKSVSVLFGLGDPRVSTEVRAAHQAAVEQTVSYLEGSCARAARGHHTPGEPYRRIATTGWAAVAFEHRSSRSGDPQLHTHVVVPNVVCGTDGRYSAWDTSEAYRQASTGGYVYQAVLRAELTRRLGVRWGRVRHGVAEVTAVPAELRRLFSSRRQAIEEHLEAHGQSGPRAAQVAALATRPPKGRHTDSELRERWTGQARDAGFDPTLIVDAAVDRGDSASGGRVDRSGSGVEPSTVADRVLGERGVTARSASFGRRGLLRAVCEAVPVGSPVSVTSLRALATAVIRDPRVVPLLTDVPAQTRRYSTTGLIATEARALHHAAARADDQLGWVDPDVVAGCVAGAGLSAEQAAAVRRITSSGAGVEVIIGPAGAGKTAALRAAHDAWRAAGIPVRGAALAAIAARTLEAGTGVPSQSLTRLSRALRVGAGRGLPPAGGVLVVDEAGMVGTRDLAALIDVTGRRGVKLVLVGDPAQLPEIDAGGLFAALARSLPAATLSGNLRQRDAWERAALDLLRDGDVLDAVNAYDDAGRLHLAPDPPGARAAIVADYLRVRVGVPSVVMLTSRRVDARVLNTLTRRELLAAGQLGPAALLVAAGSRRMQWRVGDEAVVTANHYPLGLVNGSRGRVGHVDAAGVRLDTEAGPVDVPLACLQAGVLEYGYALTCHKAQGITVDVALLYASGTLTREAGYVGMSRGRSANHLYSTLEALLPEVDTDLDHLSGEPVGDSERTELTRAAVVQRLQTRGAQRLALDQADPAVRSRCDRWGASDEPGVPAWGRGR